MRITLFDPFITKQDLLPLTFTRPCSEIRVGISTIREKWEHYLGPIKNWKTEASLSNKFPYIPEGKNLFINGCVIPSPELVKKVEELNWGDVLMKEDTVIAHFGDENAILEKDELSSSGTTIQYQAEAKQINNLWDIFSFNGSEIALDMARINPGKGKIDDPFTRVYNPNNVFIETGAKVRASILNAEKGPIYIAKNAVVHEGSILYGPLAIGENSQISPGSKIRSDTSIGPDCKVGGEISNSVFQGRSNKAHDGFLGNSVIGEWCNLGADTNNSNLKNNYDEVKLWNFRLKKFQKTGLQFCGLIMGDHSKCSINTMFNTGTVVGVGANIFGSGFHSNLIPSFSWGGPQGRITFHLNKFLQTAEIVMKRRGMKMEEEDIKIFEDIFQRTAENRPWEKK